MHCFLQGAAVVQHSQIGDFCDALAGCRTFAFCLVPVPPATPTPPALPESMRLPMPGAAGGEVACARCVRQFGPQVKRTGGTFLVIIAASDGQLCGTVRACLPRHLHTGSGSILTSAAWMQSEMKKA